HDDLHDLGRGLDQDRVGAEVGGEGDLLADGAVHLGLGGLGAGALLDAAGDRVAEEAEVGRLAGGDVGAAADGPAGQDVLDQGDDLEGVGGTQADAPDVLGGGDGGRLLLLDEGPDATHIIVGAGDDEGVEAGVGDDADGAGAAAEVLLVHVDGADGV